MPLYRANRLCLQDFSRTLRTAEKNYSQLDREATTVYWNVKKFYQYLYGHKFELVVDNKPLSIILHLHAKTPSVSALRLLRYAIFLKGFNYTVRQRKSENYGNVDYFSQAPLQNSAPTAVDEELYANEQTICHISTITVTAKTIPIETAADQSLWKLKNKLLDDTVRDQYLGLHEGVILRGQRVCIPAKLQS